MDDFIIAIVLVVWSAINVLVSACLYKEHKRLIETKRFADIYRRLVFKPTTRERL